MLCRLRGMLVMAAVAGAATACQGDRATGPATSSPNFAAAAGGVETNVRIPINLGAFVPCANGGLGEVILLSGNLHILFNVTADAAGGFHVKQHFQPQGLSGTGLVTGAKYQGTGVTQSSQNMTAGQTYTFINNFRMIGQGPGNNLLVHQNFHQTINANGEITTQHNNVSIECR